MENLRLLRLPELVRKVGISRSTIYRFEQIGLFPKRKKIGPSAVGWVESEVDSWIRKQCKEVKN